MVLLAACALLAACGRSVAVQPLAMNSEQTAQDCGRLIAAMPERISAGRSWTVEPDPESTKAWGSPAVVLRCGDDIPRPQPTDQLLTIDGVDWLVAPLSEGEQFSTVGRTPGVLITVPAVYAPTASVVAEVAPVIEAGSSLSTD